MGLALDETAKADRLAVSAGRQHRAGRLAQADRLYRAALGLDARHAGSLHGLGRLAHESGQPELAVALIGQAQAQAPGVAEYALSLGLALLDCGHVEPARAALQVAVLLDPDDPRAHRALAQALQRAGRLAEAEASLRRAAGLDPQSAAAAMALGGVLQAGGRLAEAADAFAEAARLAPGDPLAWHALAAVRGRLGALSEAAAAFGRAAALLPGDAAAQANLGTALFGLGRLEEARARLERARGLSPGNPFTLSSLGLVLMGLGESALAETTLQAALRIAPGEPALALNHGTALAALDRRAEAEAVFRALAEASPGNRPARFNLATMLLARGDRPEGWAAFEARPSSAWLEASSLTEWHGEPLSGPQGERVLLRAEQGLGDSLQFLRWVTLAAVRAPLTLQLPDALLSLIGPGLGPDAGRIRLAPLDSAAAGEGCVARASLLSLPHILRAPDPPPIGWLRAAPDAVRRWRERLRAEQRSSGPTIGIAWAGSASYQFDRARSIPSARLAPLARATPALFVSLQQPPAQPEGWEEGSIFVPEAPFLDLADTAALIEALDLVISVDTAIAHLAGSLGKPVWLLDRVGGDWRWQEGFGWGADWYPALRRFAQPRPGAWDDVIQAVAEALSRGEGFGGLGPQARAGSMGGAPGAPLTRDAPPPARS